MNTILYNCFRVTNVLALAMFFCALCVNAVAWWAERKQKLWTVYSDLHKYIPMSVWASVLLMLTHLLVGSSFEPVNLRTLYADYSALLFRYAQWWTLAVPVCIVLSFVLQTMKPKNERYALGKGIRASVVHMILYYIFAYLLA